METNKSKTKALKYKLLSNPCLKSIPLNATGIPNRFKYAIELDETPLFQCPHHPGKI